MWNYNRTAAGADLTHSIQGHYTSQAMYASSPELRIGGYCWCKFYGSHADADM